MELFENIGLVKYEGLDSRSPYAFKHYNASEIVCGKTMETWLPFAMSW